MQQENEDGEVVREADFDLDVTLSDAARDLYDMKLGLAGDGDKVDGLGERARGELFDHTVFEDETTLWYFLDVQDDNLYLQISLKVATDRPNWPTSDNLREVVHAYAEQVMSKLRR